MSSPSTASLFQENRDEVMTPILPANVNGPAQQVAVQPQGPQAIIAAANDSGPSAEDKQRLAGDVMHVGNTLTDPGQGIAAKESDAMYLGKQVMGGLSQVGGGLLGILSDEHKGNDLNGNGIPDELETKVTAAPAPPQFSFPSATSGPGGMG